ncbi:MAG: hypothetical protein ABIF10_01825 [Candidatus Woesearchaeota archaeon]
MDIRKEVSWELERITDRFLDCISCPPEDSCCDFNERYRFNLSKEKASKMLGERMFQAYVRSGRIYEDTLNPERYFLWVRCPNLSMQSRCLVHERKKALGLDSCIDFPVYYWQGLLDSPTYRVGVVIDLRCSSVQKAWKSVSGYVLKVVNDFKSYDNHLNGFVRYQQDGRMRTATLEEMNCLIDALPPQHFPRKATK